MINFNEISDIVPEREKIKQLLIQEGVSGSSFQEIIFDHKDYHKNEDYYKCNTCGMIV